MNEITRNVQRKSSSSSSPSCDDQTTVEPHNSSSSFDISSFLPTDNPVFSGGFGLAVLGVGAQILRKSSTVAMQMARKHLLVTLEVTNKDRSYPWVLQWLTNQGTRTQHLSVETSLQSSSSGGVSTKFGFVPSPGFHLLRFKNRILGVERMREQQMMDLNTGKPWEKVQFVGFGRDTSIFDQILQESFELASAQEEGKTIIYTNWGTEWRPFGQPRTRRLLDSVILDEGLAEHIDKDICEWQYSASWYRERGIPYRRGYLLYGPPGSGKTSFIMALAGKLNYNICVLNLAERGLTDDRLAVALSSVPPQCIVLLEDVDAAFPHNRSTSSSLDSSSSNYASEVTFSGLLNILDGAVSSEDRLIFMTTNYVDRLDSALIRPGRVDVAHYVGDATDYQISKMFRKFYPEADDASLETFLFRVSRPISMAALQGYFLLHKDDVTAAIKHIRTIDESVVPGKREEVDSGIGSAQNEMNDRKRTPQRRRRMLTAHELDKMPFNPQYDWEKDIYTGPK